MNLELYYSLTVPTVVRVLRVVYNLVRGSLRSMHKYLYMPWLDSRHN